MADPDIQFGEGHEAPKAPRSSAEGARIKAPSGGGVQGGGAPFLTGVGSGDALLPNFLVFYFKRRVLVDSDVVNVPVTRTRA